MILPDYDEPITTSDPKDILKYADLLMLEAGLDVLDKWNVEFFGGRRSLGRCEWKRHHYNEDLVKEGRIRLSRPWYVDLGIEGMMEFASEEFKRIALEDTIRHEIAHALSIERWGIKQGGGHGREWKQMAREVHAIPERCGNNLPSRLMASYKRRCSNCHTVYKWLYQYSDRRQHYHCTKCDAPPRKSQLEVVENEEKVL